MSLSMWISTISDILSKISEIDSNVLPRASLALQQFPRPRCQGGSLALDLGHPPQPVSMCR